MFNQHFILPTSVSRVVIPAQAGIQTNVIPGNVSIFKKNHIVKVKSFNLSNKRSTISPCLDTSLRWYDEIGKFLSKNISPLHLNAFPIIHFACAGRTALFFRGLL
jgi:hypothetical protein